MPLNGPFYSANVLLTCTYFTKNSNSSNSHFTGRSPGPRYGILSKRPSVKRRHTVSVSVRSATLYLIIYSTHHTTAKTYISINLMHCM